LVVFVWPFVSAWPKELVPVVAQSGTSSTGPMIVAGRRKSCSAASYSPSS